METLEQFLSEYKPDDYERPSVTVDCALLSFDGSLKVLMIKRGNHPFKGCWALPGGFMDMHETLIEAAARELREETGLSCALHPLGLFADPARDPRTRIITAAFAALCPEKLSPSAGDDASDAALFELHINSGDIINIPKRTNSGAISLPSSACGRAAERGRSLELTLSAANITLRSRLALCSDGITTFPMLLSSDLASDHALIIMHSILWLCSLSEARAEQLLCPDTPGSVRSMLQSLKYEVML